MSIFDILRKKIIQQKENDELYELYASPQGAFEDVIKIISDVEKKYNIGWIPVSERYPENDKYILISFENFSLPVVGRYEEDENGGAFFVGDDDISCVSSGLIVNAWRLLPAAYKDGTTMSNADMIRSMTDEQLAEVYPCPYDTAGSNIMPCMLDDDVMGSPTEEYCRKCMMDWLKREVEK